jgi:hypothetical protein
MPGGPVDRLCSFWSDYDYEETAKPVAPNGGLHPNAQQIEVVQRRP